MDLKEGLPFPLYHCYLRGLDDLVLKECGVVKSTFANSTDRKSVALGGSGRGASAGCFSESACKGDFPVEHNDYLSDQKDPYVL